MTLVVVLTAAAALLDLVVGTRVLLGAGDPNALRGVAPALGTDEAASLSRVLGLAFVVLALSQGFLSVLLARGVNAARLALTLVLIARQVHAWFIASQLGVREVEGFVGLAAAVVTLLLVWNASASRFFDTRRDRELSGSMDGRGRLDEARSGTKVLDFVSRLVVVSGTVALTPGISVGNAGSLVAAVVTIALAGWLLRPVFVRVALIFGWLGAALLALFSNAAVIGAGLFVTPGVQIDSFAAAFIASWVYALVMTLLTWAFSISGRDYLTVHATRMASSGERPEPSDIPGVIFVQLDGVPAPLLENEIRAGNIPTISRWVRSGSHTWTEWTARVPSTTPVSQAGLLHGNNDGIPAFRWFDRELGRLLVANRPADAAVIEARVSDGRGLLVDDGVSISNLFSGDAPQSLLTMSGLRRGSSGLGPSTSYAAFFTHPAGFLRALILTVGEMLKEVFQARRQVRRGVEPRIHRGGSYVALRAATNVFLRDLNVALVVEAMMRGAKSVYVDFVDYDEIAHHAGVTRGESLAALYGLDDVLRSLEQVIDSGIAPRPYQVVLVSDHGQSQGATFLQRYGHSLEEFLLEHLDGVETVTAETAEVESWGPVNILLGQLSGQNSVSGRFTRRAIGERDPEAPVGPTKGGGGEAEDDQPAELTVVGSGNLGGVWFSRHPQRLSAADIEGLHPGLLTALSAHPGIGFVVVMGGGGPIALGRAGTHDLLTGAVVGQDPLALFGPNAADDFIHVMTYDSAPDIYVNSLYDPVLDEVAAFEELVGCHGGLGGWQTRPLLVHPVEWPLDEDLLDERGLLHGADAVHHQMVRWLERLGHRTNLPADSSSPTEVRPEEVGRPHGS